MGRKLRTPIPSANESLMPSLVNFHYLRKKETEMREKQKNTFDRHHGAKNLPPLEIGQPVWIKDLKSYGKIKSLYSTPRSYIVETPRGEFRRNRIHLHPSSLPPDLCLTDNNEVSLPLSKESKESSENIPTIQDNGQRIQQNGSPSKAVVDSDSTVIRAKSDHPPDVNLRKTRSGRVVKIPKRYLD